MQQKFESIPIDFSIDKMNSQLSTVIVYDLTSATSFTLALEASNIYRWNWTPQNYGENKLRLQAVNVTGDQGILNLSYEVKDPMTEVLSFDDPDLYQIVATTTISKTFTFDKTISGIKMRNPRTASITISGATQKRFIPKVNGSYAVKIITSNECIDISECISFAIESTSEEDQESTIRLYPNPVDKRLYIDYDPERNRNMEVQLLTIDS